MRLISGWYSVTSLLGRERGPREACEVDGGQHSHDVEYDTKRTEFFTSQGIRVMRFWNNEIIQNLDGVLQMITLAIGGEFNSPSPSHASRGPLPLPERERAR
jgi:Protein of unknown function (DUF559)